MNSILISKDSLFNSTGLNQLLSGEELDELYDVIKKNQYKFGGADKVINFVKWLQHLDNGVKHYNPFTNEESESIGFSPYDTIINGTKSFSNLLDEWLKNNNNGFR